MLKDNVVFWVKKVTENKGITLQQDGATSHSQIGPGLVQRQFQVLLAQRTMASIFA